MKTSAHFLATSEHSLPPSLYHLKGNPNPQVLKFEKLSDECIWQNFLATNRIIHLMRPDYFMIYKFSNSTFIYQQNINLDLGTNEVNVNKIMSFLAPGESDHIRCIDKVLCQMTTERKLQPLEYIYKICGNIVCPNPSLKRIMRTSFLIHSDTTGKPELGFFCFHDISSMVSTIKPHNYDITFDGVQTYLEDELDAKLKYLKPLHAAITPREREILKCLHEGMSSKEIAAHLFISKTTVDTHRQNMLRKWDLSNTAALLKKAREEDWI